MSEDTWYALYHRDEDGGWEFKEFTLGVPWFNDGGGKVTKNANGDMYDKNSLYMRFVPPPVASKAYAAPLNDYSATVTFKKNDETVLAAFTARSEGEVWADVQMDLFNKVSNFFGKHYELLATADSDDELEQEVSPDLTDAEARAKLLEEVEASQPLPRRLAAATTQQDWN